MHCLLEVTNSQSTCKVLSVNKSFFFTFCFLHPIILSLLETLYVNVTAIKSKLPTLEQGTDLPQPYGPLATELAWTHLEQEDGKTHAPEGNDVRN